MSTKLIHTKAATATILFVLILLSLPKQLHAQSADSIAHAMFDASKKINTLSYTMTKQERINGEMDKQQSSTKLSRAPYKVYSRQISPNDGLEVLFIGGNETALINPNGFPWINVRLDPYGGRMTKNQHHTIYDAGFDRFINILEHLFEKYAKEINSLATVEDYIDDQGNHSWKLTFSNPAYKIIDYKVKANENLISIAKTRLISSYKVLNLNPSIDDYFDIEEGDVIKITNDYSPRMTLLIDKKLLLPTKITVNNDEGLFEQYDFSAIKINPTFKPEEFTADYKGYGF